MLLVNPQYWRPIETAPLDGTDVLLCHTAYYKPQIGHYETFHPNAKGNACWRNSHGHKLGEFTHWMPLPEKPL